MRCQDVMDEHPVWCLPEDSAAKVARLMRHEHTVSIPVITDEQVRELIGVVSDRDLALKVLGESRDPDRTTAFDVMTRVVVACREDDDVMSAKSAMEEHQIRRVPVIDRRGRLVGLISDDDVTVPAPPVMREVPRRWAA